jgi:Flp pilus assembly protein TadG
MSATLSKLRRITATFLRARQGTTATVFAFALPALLGIGGFAADYSAITTGKNRLQAVVDSAALAVAREMTVSTTAGTQAQILAKQYVAANIPANTPYPINTTAALTEGGLAVKVDGSQQIATPFGLASTLGGINTISATATARVTGTSVTQRICVLALADDIKSGLFMHNGAVINAPECAMYSNSTDRNAVVIQQGSKIRSSIVCARGGIANLAGFVDSTLVTDCPVMKDPLATKGEPPLADPCIATTKVIITGKITLNPGTYCKGLFIFSTPFTGAAPVVKMNPGIYVFRDGPIVVGGNATLTGAGVSLVLTGKGSVLRFRDNALIQISAPSAGVAAGMLIWETKNWKTGFNSWKAGGCGTKPSGFKSKGDDSTESDDSGPNGCSTVQAYIQKTLKKTNEHHINSNRAKELTGTIYLPKGLLLIDSTGPIADQSPFTIFVVNKLDLYDGPVLTLNSNYTGTTVPVPPGLTAAIGGTNVRLGQ